MNIINVSKIDIFIPEGPLGIMCSGGADSAILCYIMMSQCSNPLIFYTFASSEKQNITVTHSKQVISKCQEITGRDNISHRIIYVNKQTRINLIQFLENEINTDNVKMVYTGTTNTPPKNDLSLFKNSLAMDVSYRRDSTKIKPTLHHKNRWHDPFINVDKKKIRELYEYYDILETVFPLTRSCESLTEFTKHCENCWWCEERNWAFHRYI